MTWPPANFFGDDNWPRCERCTAEMVYRLDKGTFYCPTCPPRRVITVDLPELPTEELDRNDPEFTQDPDDAYDRARDDRDS